MTTVLGYELDGDGQRVIDLGGGIAITLDQHEPRESLHGFVPGVSISTNGTHIVYINAAWRDEMTAQMRLLDRLQAIHDAIGAFLVRKPEETK